MPVELVEIYHEETGKRLRVSSVQVDGLRKLGWKPKGEKVEAPEEDSVASLNLNSSSQVEPSSAFDPQENDSWQE